MILNIYKEKTWTSFDVVAKLRGLLKTKKIGHAGTLDPLAEGVLIVLTDKDTKKQDDYMHLEKEYVADIAFGCSTNTYDLEGEAVFHTEPILLKEVQNDFENLLPKYIGELDQTVPPYSAVKVGGKKLYSLARSGKSNLIDLPIKKVFVKNITINSWKIVNMFDRKLPVVNVTITCGSGFYVRSFAHDIGKELGFGGVLAGLQRTRVGDFRIAEAKKVSELV